MSRIVLITGASDGLGRELALQLADQGDTVVLLGRSVAKLEQVYDEIEEAGGATPALYPLDMAGATAQEFEQMVQRISEELGGIDIVIQNAAMLGTLTPVELLEPEQWQAVLSANLLGPSLLSQAIIPSLRKRQGKLVFIVDEAESAYWGAYGVAKAGLSALANIIDAENDQIQVIKFHPGVMRTALRSAAFPGENPNNNPDPAIAASRLIGLL